MKKEKPVMTALPVTASQIKPAAQALSRAFHDDPYYTYIIPDVGRRANIMTWLFERILRYGMLYGSVYTTPSVEASAIWLGPQNPIINWIGAIRTGLFQLALKMKRAEYRRIQLLDKAGDRLHKLVLPGPHWYLLILGVDPTHQGQGMGGALLQPVLEAADRDHLACFLDTNNEKNLLFYERHGFKVVGQEQPDPLGPYVWVMLREPR
jgi:ribosomal protein S18 acetylase RimI-like enzyme